LIDPTALAYAFMCGALTCHVLKHDAPVVTQTLCCDTDNKRIE